MSQFLYFVPGVPSVRREKLCGVGLDHVAEVSGGADIIGPENIRGCLFAADMTQIKFDRERLMGKRVTIRSLAKDKVDDLRIQEVSIVDSPADIPWKLTDQGLFVTTPHKAPNKIAICYRIETEGLPEYRAGHSPSDVGAVAPHH